MGNGNGRVRINVLPRGALGDGAQPVGFTDEQRAAIDEADRPVRDWLSGSPERAEMLLADPVAALEEALPEGPPPELVELLLGPDGSDQRGVDLAAADADIRFAEHTPSPALVPQMEIAQAKASQADNDVTYMVGLQPLAKAFQNLVGPEIRQHLAAGPLPPLDLPDVPVPVQLEVTPRSTEPALDMKDGNVTAELVFAAHLRVGDGALTLDDDLKVVMRMEAQASASEGLRIAVVPTDGGATVGSPNDADPSADPTLSDATDTGELGDPWKELDEIADEIDEKIEDEDPEDPADVCELLTDVDADVCTLLTTATPDDVREAVETMMVDTILPLFRLEADVPHLPVACTLAPRFIGAAFLPAGDDGQEPALAIGLNYVDSEDEIPEEEIPSIEFPESSRVPHGLESWLELSNSLQLRLACCLMPEMFTDLPPSRTPQEDELSCRWEDASVHDAEGTQWNLHHLEVTVSDGLMLDAVLSRSPIPGVKFTASIQFGMEVGEGDQLLRITDREVAVDAHIEWWARLALVAGLVAIGALFGGLVGLLAGGVIAGVVIGAAAGAVVGVGLVLLFEAVLDLIAPNNKPEALDGLESPLRLLPVQITDVFGEPDPLPEFIEWDDLEAAGRVVAPGETPQLTIPSVVGMQRAEAERMVDGLGLTGITRHKFSDEEHGTVIAQRPSAGSERPEGSRVQLDVSRGGGDVPLGATPEVVGKQEEAARTALGQAGFDVIKRENAHSKTRPVGRVIDQRPDPGTKVRPGTEATIVVSLGKAPDPGDRDDGGGTVIK